MRLVCSELLFLIWLIPLLGLVAVHGLRRRRRILSSYATDHALAAIAPKPRRSRYGIKAAMVLGAMLLGIFALSGPQYGFRWQEMHRRGVDLVIAIDCSKSMTATDIPPSRLERAKREIVDLLNMMTGDRVGLVAFAGTAFLQCPLTLDYQSFHLFLSALSPEVLPVGGTDLSEAVTVALSAFGSESGSDKAVILITDGESTGADPLKAAEKAKKAGVRLFCIGVGKPEGAPIPHSGGFQKDSDGRIFMSRLDEATLEKMATLTDGGYVRSVAGDMDLELIYQDQIQAKMKAADLSGGRRKVWENRYQWALVPALVLLIWEMLMPAHGRRRASVIFLVSTACLLTAPGAEAGWLNPSLHAGIAAYEKGDFPAALKSFIDAQLKDPDRPEIDYNIGNAHYRLNDYASAARSFEQAARGTNPQLKQKAMYNMGNALFRAGDLEGAVEAFQKALDLDPEDQAARKNLEFAKKALQDQKKQPSQAPPSGGRENGPDKKEEPGKASPDRSGESKDQTGDPRDRPNKKPPAQPGRGPEGKGKAGQGRGGDKGHPPPEPQGAEPSSKMAGEPGEPSREPEQARSEQILNRLQDRPGRALMPAYGNRPVDKDW